LNIGKPWPIEHRQTLTRIENERNAGRSEIAGVLHHAFAAVRRNDAELCRLGMFHLVQMRKAHCARMESRDLVVVEIGGDESLRRKSARHMAHVRTRQAELVKTIEVRGRIVAHRRHDQRFTAEQHQVVGDIAGATAVFAAHFRDQKGDVQDVNLLGQDMVLEAVREDHDVVESQRAADKCRHVMFRDRKCIADSRRRRCPALRSTDEWQLRHSPGSVPG
jgi:hypothetical protein